MSFVISVGVKSELITSQQPLRVGAMAAYPYSAELDARLTFKTRFNEEVKGGVRDGNTLWVPREVAPKPLGPPFAEDYRVFYPNSPAIDCTFQPRHEQGDLCQQSINLLMKGQNHIFEAPTGWGKTVAGGYIACKMGQPTLIVVTKDDLMGQWKDTLINVLKIPPALVGHVQQDTCDWEGKQFVLGMVHSLIIPGRYPEEMYKYFGLMILDEVHQMAADCFIRICQKIPAKRRLGFSATPDRTDGKTKLLKWHVGPTLVRGKVIAMKPKVLIRKTGWKIPTRKVLNGTAWEFKTIPHGPGRMMLVIKAMASSPHRNQEIINFTTQSYNSGRRTLLLSDLREFHLDKLFLMLTAAGVPGNDIGYYVGGMTKLELALTKTKKVILATYQMASTGTDCPVWDTLVMATPRANVKQSVGRVLREADQKRQPVILDLVDDSSILQSFHKSRVQQYYAIGAAIVKV